MGLLQEGIACNMSRDVKTINSASMPDREIRAIAEWLIDGARSAPQPEQVLAQLSERLVACGIPLWRVAVFVRTLHPQIMGRRFIWRPGTEVEISEAPFELLETPDFLENPIAQVYATGRALRRKLADPDCAVDFPVLSELRAEGITDYLALPLFFTDGAIHAVTCTTRQPGGFTDAQIAGIEAIITRWRGSPRSERCGGRRARCSTPMSGMTPASASSPGISGAAISRRSTRRSGCRTCAGSPHLADSLPPPGADRPPQPLFRLPGSGDPRRMAPRC